MVLELGRTSKLSFVYFADRDKYQGETHRLWDKTKTDHAGQK